MFTDRQFKDSISFYRDLQDAMKCIEQCEERKAQRSNYATFSTQIFEGIREKQIAIGEKGIVKGENFESWGLYKALAHA